MSEIQILTAAIAVLSVSLVGALFYLSKKLSNQKQNQATPTVPIQNVPEARDVVIKAQEEALKIKKEVQDEAQIIRQKLFEEEKAITAKQEAVTRKLEEIETKEQHLLASQRGVSKKLEDIEHLRQDQIKKLETVAGVTKDEARKQILLQLERSLQDELGKRVRDAEDAAREKADLKAKEILVEAMQHAGTDYVAEYTTSIVKLPDEEMKGRIIGREGRNIKAYEMATGVSVDLDETPGQLRISCFDPVRREIARVSLERLIADGRIQPAKIEEIVSKTQKDVEKLVHEADRKSVV